MDFRIEMTFNDVEYNNQKFNVCFTLKVNMYELKHNMDFFLEKNKDLLPCRMHGDIVVLNESIETTIT